MPIKIVSVYAASDGQTFATELEAKQHELEKLLDGLGIKENPEHPISTAIAEQWPMFVEIMDVKPDVPPKRRPRSDKGKNHAKRNQVMAVSLEETK